MGTRRDRLTKHCTWIVDQEQNPVQNTGVADTELGDDVISLADTVQHPGTDADS